MWAKFRTFYKIMGEMGEMSKTNGESIMGAPGDVLDFRHVAPL